MKSYLDNFNFLISIKFFLLISLITLIFFNFFDIPLFQKSRDLHGLFFSFFKSYIDPLSDILDPLNFIIFSIIFLLLSHNINKLIENKPKSALLESRTGLKKTEILLIFNYYTLLFKYWLSSLIVAGIICNAIKFIIGAARPKYFFLYNYERINFFNIEHKVNSFPSGHTQAAFTVAVLFLIYFKRYHLIIIGAAILMGLSRIFMSMHFPSDLIFGAYIGSLIPIVIYKFHFKFKFDKIKKNRSVNFFTFCKLLYWRIFI